MKINQYTQETVGLQGNSVRAGANAFGGNTAGLQAQAQGMASAARDLGITADILRDVQVRKESSDYAAMMAEKQLELAQVEQTLKQSEFADGVDISKEYGQRYDEVMKSIEENIPRTQRDRFQADKAVLRARFAEGGLQEQGTRAALKIKTNWEKTLTASINSIALNPNNYGASYELMRQQVESMPGGAEVKEAALIKGTQALKGALMETQIARNPSDFIRKAKAGEYSDVPDVARYINAAENRIDQIEARGERALAKQSEQNYFEMYAVLSDPQQRAQVTKDTIVTMVRNDKLKPSDGRALVNLLNSEEAKDDDLNAFAELSRQENAGTLTASDIIEVHAAGRLKTSTAKSLIAGVTANLSNNEAYKSNKERIRAEFDKSDFGQTKGEAAVKEAEALREYQRQAANLKDGESLDVIAEGIIKRLRDTAQSDRTYSRQLYNIRKNTGANINNVKDLEQAADRVMKASQKGILGKDEAEQQLSAIKRKIEELESTNGK